MDVWVGKCKVWNSLKARFKTFQMQPDPEQAARVNELLRGARITLVEHYLFAATEHAGNGDNETKMKEARDQVNLQIRSFDMVGIKSSDIQPVLWMAATKVTKGQPPS